MTRSTEDSMTVTAALCTLGERAPRDLSRESEANYIVDLTTRRSKPLMAGAKTPEQVNGLTSAPEKPLLLKSKRKSHHGTPMPQSLLTLTLTNPAGGQLSTSSEVVLHLPTPTSLNPSQWTTRSLMPTTLRRRLRRSCNWVAHSPLAKPMRAPGRTCQRASK